VILVRRLGYSQRRCRYPVWPLGLDWLQRRL